MVSGSRRHLVKLGAIAISAALLTGCSTGTDSAGGGKNIRMLVNITPVLTKQFYKDLVAGYVADHPGVKVTIEAPTGRGIEDTLKQQLAAGSPPDILAGGQNTALAGQMAPLPDAQWVKDSPFAEASKLDGKVWMAGTGVQLQSLVFYNKDAFTKAGVTSTPKTFDEFTAALRKLKGAGYTPMQTGGEWTTGAQALMMANPNVMNTEPQWNAKRNKGSVTFAGSNYAKFLDVYQSWIKDGLVPKDANGIKYQDMINNFTAGKSATMVMGNWLAASLADAKPGFDAGVFPVPTFDGSTPPQAANPAMPYSVLKSSKHTAEAIDLVKYLVSDKKAVTKGLSAEGNFRTGYSYKATPLTNDIAKLLDAAGGKTVAIGPGLGDNSSPAGFPDELNTQVQSMYLGTSADRVAGAMDKWWSANAPK
ncbi:extracellular solute-binding protein [Streptomyces laculatispora]|uniref:Extracellular solute-binding protein n=1 Tax=Streptomyces laculatispora TaxID=887464 RepID=A0ABY9HWM4_9ACTN|nr:extracellular solute-binding protein [Streptomyces laculatispora]WLQ38696.1 extracellular solute-binding protein [Streptomyces laculatispora]